MKCNVIFKNIDFSKALVEYVEGRFSKVNKFQVKPATAHITFSHERHKKVAKVYLRGLQVSFRAQSSSDSLYASIDKCLKKIERQMEREKSKIKHHHDFLRSSSGMLEEQILQEKQIKDSA